ncbi:MAG TPA: hypothetical protein VGN42_28075 [Pirellulales bacterium]|jgi:hypothetical protein|nr:hypothetical protein [Pirellulales bacterium]
MSSDTCVSGPAVSAALPSSGRQLPGTSSFPEAGLPSPEQIQQQIAPVLNMTLSPRLEYWASRYAEVGKRNVYLWKWCRQGVEITTLPCVMPEFRDEVGETRVLGIMLDVLLDDVADRKGNGDLLDKLLSLSFHGPAPSFSEFPKEERAYAEFTVEVWEEIKLRASRFPCYSEYAKLLHFDYLQLFNVMRYSHLLNEDISLLNMAEHDLYTPHNMHMIISGTLDLMCAPEFNRDELGLLRGLLWHAQCMGRVGNLVTTWERELADGDYTSGVYASAVSSGDVTLEQLRRGDREQIRDGIVNGGHEAYFLNGWHDHRRYLLEKAPLIRSFDFGENIRGLERLICIHLGSRGYK